ncbi:hypothetical protein KX816_05250 [Sphingosinicellaceae bacterium]|nr:hypothetical protein KX816_05250 [Sphingosinicellaceae bacterium]
MAGLEHQKDEILDRLARIGNVAQFFALRPSSSGPVETFSRIKGREPNQRHSDIDEAISGILNASADRMVNVRSYTPDSPRSREFVYGLNSLEAVANTIARLTAEGLHLIINETIDVSDGGVSGVVQGGTIEFAPDDTPRCVEKPGVASLPFEDGVAMLRTVYGFAPDLHAADGERTEFSIHPRPSGWRGTHTLLWEHETGTRPARPTEPSWPNRFSRLIGDKAFGLLVADRLGLPVPRTLVIGRRVAPFSFGRPTGSAEVWTRTCPTEPQPGLYTTVKGWTDPFALLAAEDADADVIASVLRQDAVQAAHSGAAIVGPDGQLLVEGRSGEGDLLMLGTQGPQPLPVSVTSSVRDAHVALAAHLGPVRFEWVHDGLTVWVVQLHRGATQSTGRSIVPGDAREWREFKVGDGLERLRAMLVELPAGDGVVVHGDVGMTSHVADLLRRAGAPARLGPPPAHN